MKKVLPSRCSLLAIHQGHPKCPLNCAWFWTSVCVSASKQQQRAWTLDNRTTELCSQVSESSDVASSTNLLMKRLMSGWLEPNHRAPKTRWLNSALGGSSLIMKWIGHSEALDDLYKGLPSVLNVMVRWVHSRTPLCWSVHTQVQQH